MGGVRVREGGRTSVRARERERRERERVCVCVTETERAEKGKLETDKQTERFGETERASEQKGHRGRDGSDTQRETGVR